MLISLLPKHLSRAQVRLVVSQCRSLSTTACLCKRAKHPYDKRFPIFPKDVASHKEGGSAEVTRQLGLTECYPQPPGYRDDRGRFHLVPEMIPEFVVPDLSDFELKPYVSYQAPEIKQSEFTAKDLFNACYAHDVVQKYKAGKLKDLDSLLPSEDKQTKSDQAS